MALLYFDERESAERCTASLDSFAFDKNHTFSVVPFKEAKLLDAPDPKWQPPAKEPYNDVVRIFFKIKNNFLKGIIKSKMIISFPGRCVVVDAEPALSRSVRGSVRTTCRWRQLTQRNLPLCAQRLLAQEEQRA